MGVSLEPEKLCIITELMARGSLYDILRDQQMEIPFTLAVRMAIDCLKGLQFIHSAGFIHRDLKYLFLISLFFRILQQLTVLQISKLACG
jgi:serine/threonine protein kinase